MMFAQSPFYTRAWLAIPLVLLTTACPLFEDEDDDDSSTGPSSTSSGSLAVGSAITGLSGTEGLARRYSFNASGSVTISMSGGSGDPDLFVRVGTPPTLTTYDCASQGSSTTESCTIDANGTVHVMVYGFSNYSGVRLAASSGSSGGGSGGGGTVPSGNLNLRCPGSLPNGYHCLTAGSSQAPGRYVGLPVLYGVWEESSFGVCMTLTSSGTSSFRYQSGFPAETNRRWGALVNASGQLQPSDSQFYVATGSGDPQIALLTWSGSRFVGFNFRPVNQCRW